MGRWESKPKRLADVGKGSGRLVLSRTIMERIGFKAGDAVKVEVVEGGLWVTKWPEEIPEAVPEV